MRHPASDPRATVCPVCGGRYSSATTQPVCPIQAARDRERARADKAVGITERAAD